MRLTWRDGVETLLGIAVLSVVLAVTREWGWPMLGSPRAGVVVLAIIGQAMCQSAGWSKARWSDPFIVTASALGVVTLGLIVAGLVAGTTGHVVALAVALWVMWAVSTVHHAVRRGPALGSTSIVAGRDQAHPKSPAIP